MSSSGTDSDLAKKRILADLAPVTPLAEPWRRALVVVPVAVVAALAVWGFSGLRPDFATVGAGGTWGASLFFVLAAYGFFVLLAREVIPGAAVTVTAWTAAAVATLTAQTGIAALLHRVSPYPVPAGQAVAMTVACTVAISLLGAPFVVAGWLLARRALPLRVCAPALLTALGGAVAAEATWRLHCPFTSPVHFLEAHVPPYAVLAVVAIVAFGRMRRRPGSDRRSEA